MLILSYKGVAILSHAPERYPHSKHARDKEKEANEVVPSKMERKGGRKDRLERGRLSNDSTQTRAHQVKVFLFFKCGLYGKLLRSHLKQLFLCFMLN